MRAGVSFAASNGEGPCVQIPITRSPMTRSPDGLLRCRCAAHNFNDLFRNLCLAGAVHGQRERINHVRSVAGGRIHRRHARGVLGGLRLQHGAEQLHGDVARQQIAEQPLRRLLVNVVDRRRGKARGFLVDFSRIRPADADAGMLGRFQSLLALLFAWLPRSSRAPVRQWRESEARHPPPGAAQ